MEKKTVTIEIPDGKRAEWVNGVLTLVDEAPQNIMERVKTFEDACNVLGEDNPLVKQYEQWSNSSVNNDEGSVEDVDAYMKLRIIVAALNEGWVPQFTEDEWRWYPWFYLYTEEELEDKDDEWKKEHAFIDISGRLVGRSSTNANAFGGLACADAYCASSYSDSNVGSRFAFKSQELAVYAGKQFIEIYADFHLM